MHILVLRVGGRRSACSSSFAHQLLAQRTSHGYGAFGVRPCWTGSSRSHEECNAPPELQEETPTALVSSEDSTLHNLPPAKLSRRVGAAPGTLRGTIQGKELASAALEVAASRLESFPFRSYVLLLHASALLHVVDEAALNAAARRSLRRRAPYQAAKLLSTYATSAAAGILKPDHRLCCELLGLALQSKQGLGFWQHPSWLCTSVGKAAELGLTSSSCPAVGREVPSALLAIPLASFKPMTYTKMLWALRKLDIDIEPFRNAAANHIVVLARSEKTDLGTSPQRLKSRLFQWMRRLTNSAVWEQLGLRIAVEKRIYQSLPDLPNAAFVVFLTALQASRCDTEEFWTILMADAAERRLSNLAPVHLARLLHVQGRSIFAAPPGLFTAAVRRFKGGLHRLPPDALAKLLRSFMRSAVVEDFCLLINSNAADLRTLLDGKGAQLPVLYSLVNCRQLGCELDWWHDLVLKPWEKALQDVAEVLRLGPDSAEGGSAYVAAVQKIRLSDLGPQFTTSMLSRLGVEMPDEAFLQRAEAVVTSARTGNTRELATRTYGFFSFCLESSNIDSVMIRESGQVLSSGTRPTKHADSLLQAVDVGFLEDRHPRTTDTELTALNLALEKARVAMPGLLDTSEGRSTLAGEVQIFADRTPCLSCLGVMAQFRAALPGVRLCVGFTPHDYRT